MNASLLLMREETKMKSSIIMDTINVERDMELLGLLAQSTPGGLAFIPDDPASVGVLIFCMYLNAKLHQPAGDVLSRKLAVH